MIFIGDIHGHLEELLKLIDKTKCDPKDIYFCGDLIDRGPDSAGVVQWVIDNGAHCVMGNHESLMVNRILDNSIDSDELWSMNGGDSTIASYKDKGWEIDKHLDWLRSLPYCMEIPWPSGKRPSIYLSHAGLHMGYGENDFHVTEDKLIKNKDIMWHRDPIANFKNVFQVIGHTPQYFGPRKEEHFINLDGGGYMKRPGYGKFFAWDSETDVVHCYDRMAKE